MRPEGTLPSAEGDAHGPKRGGRGRGTALDAVVMELLLISSFLLLLILLPTFLLEAAVVFPILAVRVHYKRRRHLFP